MELDLDAKLLKDDFDCEEVLQSYLKTVTLDTLDTELEAYVERVNAELLRIINDDYSSFLELSQMLVHIDSKVAELESPLQAMKDKVENLHSLISEPVANQRELKHALEKVHKKRNFLELSLGVWETVASLEPDSQPASISQLDIEESDSRRARLRDLERKAQAFSRLPFVVHKDSKLPLLQEANGTVSELEESLIEKLQVEFSVEISPDRVFGESRVVDKESILQCLRSYSLLGKTSEAEKVFREACILPFLKSICTTSKLDGGVRNSCSGLPQIYQEIINFVARECKMLLKLTNLPSEGVTKFDFVGNGVAKSVVLVLTEQLPQVYSSGSASTLKENYHLSKSLFKCLEQLTLHKHSVFRRENEYLSNWNVMYFEKCFQEATQILETALSSGNTLVQVESPSALLPKVSLKATNALCEAVNFSLTMKLPGLNSDIVKLIFQLVTRYLRWSQNGTSVFLNQYHVHVANELLETIVTTEDKVAQNAWNEATPLHLQLLSDDCSVVVSWMKDLCDKVQGLVKVSDDVGASFEALERYTLEVSHVCQQGTVRFVVSQCQGQLAQVEKIPDSFYFRGRDMPTSPSPYVSKILQPLLETLQTCKPAKLGSDDKLSCVLVEEVLEEIVNEFLKVSELTWGTVTRKVEAMKKVTKLAPERIQEMEAIRAQLLLDLSALVEEGMKLGLSEGRFNDAKLALESKTKLAVEE